MPLPKVLLSHSGKQHSYQVAKALYDLEALKKYYTSGYVRNEKKQAKYLEAGNEFWTRRFIPGLPASHVSAWWDLELPEFVVAKLFGKGNRLLREVFRRDERFDRRLATKLKKVEADIFWGFQGSSYHSMIAARDKGMTIFHELSTAHYAYAHKILGEEKERQPEWAGTIDILEFPEKYLAKVLQEPTLADKVIAASTFTIDSLKFAGIAEEKIQLLPLGADIDAIPYDAESLAEKKRKPGPLKALFAGTLTQRKGIYYLLEAMAKLRGQNVELHTIGHAHDAEHLTKPYQHLFTQNAPTDQASLFRRYSDYDVLVLPTLFEGFGLVLVEAMAAGLPVITTSHSMGPDLVEEGENGYIVPIRDAEAIAEKLASLAEKQPEERIAMSKAARQAAENYSWQVYAERLSHFLQNFAEKQRA